MLSSNNKFKKDNNKKYILIEKGYFIMTLNYEKNQF